MASNALKIDEKDNVAVASRTIAKGEAVIITKTPPCRAIEEIRPGHKVALTAIPRGGKVLRYGEVIVEATRDIAQGEWVHVHNTRPILSDK